MIGEAHQGLKAMFTMMNYERLSVGLQGLGAGDLAYQHSARYAQDRVPVSYTHLTLPTIYSV